MIIISELNYLLSQKVPAEIFSEDEKAIIYYENTDTIPAKAFGWLNKISGKINLVPFAEIGGRNNISFAVGGYVALSKTASAVIVGEYDTEERVVKIGESEYKIYTTPDFQSVLTLDKNSTKKNTNPASTNSGNTRIDKIAQLIPARAIPSGMDVTSFAQVLDNAIAKSRGNTADIAKSIEENLGRNVSENLQVLYSTGAYGNIVDLVLKS